MAVFPNRAEAIERYSVELRRFGIHEALIPARAAELADRHLAEMAVFQARDEDAEKRRLIESEARQDYPRGV